MNEEPSLRRFDSFSFPMRLPAFLKILILFVMLFTRMLGVAAESGKPIRVLILSEGRLAAEGDIAALTAGGRSLEDVFLQLTGRGETQKGGEG